MYRSISLFTSPRSIMLFISIPSWPFATLVYLCKLLLLKYMLPTHSPLYSQNSTILVPLLFSPGTPKTPVMPTLVLPPIHPFRSPLKASLKEESIWLLSFVTLSTVFQIFLISQKFFEITPPHFSLSFFCCSLFFYLSLSSLQNLSYL